MGMGNHPRFHEDEGVRPFVMRKSPELSPLRFPRSNWLGIVLLGLVGQIAWVVENQYFNLFLYNEIIPDPRPISWMVAATAVVNAVAAVTMGTLSDRIRSRWGRRKPFLVFGYVAWGIFTALFPSAAVLQPVGYAIFMAILFDCLMTFFGAAANDAAFQAYITDITSVSNRGRVTGVLQIAGYLALLLVFGGAPLMIDALGFPVFFTLIGGIVLLAGLLSTALVNEKPVDQPPTGTYWGQIAALFKLETWKSNRSLSFVLLSVIIFTTGQNVFYPYILIYLEHYLQLSPQQYATIMGSAILLGGVLLAFPLGRLVDRIGRRSVGFFAIGCTALGLILFSQAQSFPTLVLFAVIWFSALSAWIITSLTWTKDLFPHEQRGQFAGLYMFCYVLIPQIVGPMIGSTLGTLYGIPTVIDGQAGFIPTPILFQVASGCILLAAVPLIAATDRAVSTVENLVPGD